MKLWKKRAPKPYSIAYYIDEVFYYRARYEADNRPKDSYPPVVAELLLSLLICVRPLLYLVSYFAGALLLLLVKALFGG